MAELHPAVAIVDDDPSVLRSLKRLLETQRWEVYTYDSAEAFFGRRSGLALNLALVDICLPGASGIELLKQVESERRGPAVILMTALSERETAAADLLGSGRAVYLRKPFTLEEFQEAVRCTRLFEPLR